MDRRSLPGTLDSLSSIGAYVLAAASEAGLDSNAAYRLRLAVDEIATNAITHGYQEAGRVGSLEVWAVLDEEALTVFLEDSAAPYDPRQTPLPDTLDRPLEQRNMGGLGIYLTVQAVDTFLYEQVGDRNRHIFVMQRSAAARARAGTRIGRVLLVMNEGLERNMLDRQVDVLSYGVTPTSNEQQAVELIHSQSFDAVLLQVDPDIEPSEEVLRELKASGAPVIALWLSPEPAVERISHYLGIGADDYLIEPFSAAMLQARLNTCRELRELRRQKQSFEQNEELLKLAHDVQTGHDIQMQFLPTVLPQPEGWEISAGFHPAREVAGDFYDAFPMIQGRRIGFIIADVCDKGVGAALYMALFRSLVHAFAQQNYPERDLIDMIDKRAHKEPLGRSEGRRVSPGIAMTALKEAMLRTNNYIIDNHSQAAMFVTMFFGVLDPETGALVYINGGHNPPAIIGPDGVKSRLKPTGPAVGLMPDGPFEVEQTILEPGDTLFCYTDGVTDARDPGGVRFGEERMLSLVSQPASSAGVLLSGVEASVRSHIASAAQFDDITMLAVRRLPRP